MFVLFGRWSAGHGRGVEFRSMFIVGLGRWMARYGLAVLLAFRPGSAAVRTNVARTSLSAGYGDFMRRGRAEFAGCVAAGCTAWPRRAFACRIDRKSTRLNSSH